MTTAPRAILLVEDTPAHVDLTLRAFQRAGITDPVEGVSGGVEALESLFARGTYAGRAGSAPLSVMLLELKRGLPWLVFNRVPPAGSHP